MERLGEKALLLRDLPVAPYLVARALNDAAFALEAVASYETVGLYYDRMVLDLDSEMDRLEGALAGMSFSSIASPVHSIPVCYELGSDLASAALSLELSADAVIEAHCGVDLDCFAVGFCPGFAYLGYLPSAIARLGRLASPRSRVEPGSVGITGRQTAVYTLPTPGGWHLIGRTPLVLVDEADDYFPIAAGDRVRFRRIDEAEYRKLEGARL